VTIKNVNGSNNGEIHQSSNGEAMLRPHRREGNEVGTAATPHGLRLALGLYLLLAVGSCLGGQPRPVAFVGAKARSPGDRKFFEYYVTAELGVAAVDCGEFLDPGDFHKYILDGFNLFGEQFATTPWIKAKS